MKNFVHVQFLVQAVKIEVGQQAENKPTAPLTTPCVFGIFADWRQFALEIDACTTDVTSLGWGGVGMLTFMLTCVTCTTDVTSLGWGGVGMLTFMLTCVTCTTDVTSLGWGGVGC